MKIENLVFVSIACFVAVKIYKNNKFLEIKAQNESAAVDAFKSDFEKEVQDPNFLNGLIF